jgi:hypothetical protein
MALERLYRFFTVAGDAEQGSRGRWVRVAFGNRPYDHYRDVEMRPTADGGMRPVAVTGSNVEQGPELRYLLIPDGSVDVYLLPAASREMLSNENGLVLDHRLDASDLLNDRIIRMHWNALLTYGAATSFGIAASRFERLRVFWLRQSRWHIGEDNPPSIYKVLWGVAKLIPAAAKLIGGYMWPGP